MIGNNQKLIPDYIDLCEQQAELIDMQSAMIKALNEQIKSLDNVVKQHLYIEEVEG
jgi:hypothetical protein